MADSTRPSEEDKQAERKRKACERNRRYRERHPGRDREYYLANRESILQRCKDYREKTKDKKKARDKRYYEENKERIQAAKKTDRAREAQKEYARKIASDPERRQARREKDRIYSRRYRERHPQKRKESAKAWRDRNKEAQRESFRKRVEKNPEHYRKAAANRTRDYRKRFRLKHGASCSAVRAKTDAVFKLVVDTRRRVYMAMKQANASKSARTLELLGCTVGELFRHLESKFTDGMSWSNRQEWHIDHIIPLSKFDLSDLEQQAAAFHYTNLQPLWAKDNLRKSNKVEGQNLFGFAYAARIADKASATPKKRRKRGG